jgi:hypothetical protein
MRQKKAVCRPNRGEMRFRLQRIGAQASLPPAKPYWTGAKIKKK